jgi:hypothetical protein
MAEIDIKLTGIAQIKKELRELKGELASATDPTQMAELSKQAGVLSDQLKDANERVAVFASGSPFEQTNNALGLMGSQLMSLDFEGAAESAKLFASAAKGINPAQMATQLKSLGTVVFEVGKAFVSIGASLLMNPIFLIAAAIAAIVAIVGVLMNKLGLLQPILDALSAAFGAVMDVINSVIQGLKDFTDWLGLSTNAADDAAERQINAQQAIADAYEDKSAKVLAAYDQEIRMAQLDGDNTVKMEIEKAKYIKLTALARAEQYVMQYEAAKKSGDLDAEELNKLKKQAEEQLAIATKAQGDVDYLRKKNTKDNEANDRKVADNEKKIQDERIKAAQDFRKKQAELAAKKKKEQEDEIARLKEIRDKEIEIANQTQTAFNDMFAKKAENDEARKLKEEEYVANVAATRKQWADNAIAEQQRVLKEEADAQQKRIDNSIAYGNAFADATKSGLQGAADIVNAFAGKSIAAQKKAFETTKKLNIAMAVIDTIKGAVSAFTGMTSTIPGPVGIALGAIAAAGVVASGVANVKKIKDTKFEGGGSASASTGASVASSANATQPMQPQLFGQNNNQNNLTAPQDAEKPNNNMVVKAVVVESDVTATQARVKGIQSNATL